LNGIGLGKFAVKAIPVGNSQLWLERILSEVKLLEKLRHQNIIEYKHAWMEDRQLSPFSPKVPCLFILMELADGGNLEEYLHVEWDPPFDAAKEKAKFRTRLYKLSEPASDPLPKSVGGIGYDEFGKKVRYLTTYEIWKFLVDITSGLAHLHAHGIIHRDLKPSNLLLKNHPGSLPTILVSDFGESEVMNEVDLHERTGATGTLEFMPPELLCKDEFGKYRGEHSPKAV
jgi:serine/threonine protein kinase